MTGQRRELILLHGVLTRGQPFEFHIDEPAPETGRRVHGDQADGWMGIAQQPLISGASPSPPTIDSSRATSKRRHHSRERPAASRRPTHGSRRRCGASACWRSKVTVPGASRARLRKATYGAHRQQHRDHVADLGVCDQPAVEHRFQRPHAGVDLVRPRRQVDAQPDQAAERRQDQQTLRRERDPQARAG